MNWLSYLVGFGIVLGAIALLVWAFARQARGKGGCGSGCCGCAFFGEPDERPAQPPAAPDKPPAGRT